MSPTAIHFDKTSEIHISEDEAVMKAPTSQEIHVATFSSKELAMERINQVRPALCISTEREHNPDDPNADETGHVWVVVLCQHPDNEKLHLCNDGNFR
jgi:sucrose-6-phosphate hydrolase SacC (GH32 family)